MSKDLPGVNEVMPQVLRLLSDGKIHTRSDVMDTLADQFGLSEEQRTRQMKDSSNTYWGNIIDFVRRYFTPAGLIETPQESNFRLTTCGHYVFENHLAEVSIKFLNRFQCPKSQAPV